MKYKHMLMFVYVNDKPDSLCKNKATVINHILPFKII